MRRCMYTRRLHGENDLLTMAQTDVLPALSLCLEKPESGLLERPPRNVKTERLADWKLLLQAYGFLGVLESLSAMSMYVFHPCKLTRGLMALL